MSALAFAYTAMSQFGDRGTQGLGITALSELRDNDKYFIQMEETGLEKGSVS